MAAGAPEQSCQLHPPFFFTELINFCLYLSLAADMTGFCSALAPVWLRQRHIFPWQRLEKETFLNFKLV